MSETLRHVRPATAESLGQAPGRGRLEGRRILVVGGGQRTFDAATDPVGNGRAMCVLFAREGAQVAVADINLESARETLDLIQAGDGQGVAIAADVTSEPDVIRMVKEAAAALGGLDGLVLNVGIFGQTGLKTFDLEEWDRVLNTNLRGPMLCCRHAVDRMDDDSSIVFMSSIAALKAGSQLVPYDAAKAGLVGLARHMALEGAKRGIRVNTVVPGLVDTPLGRLTTAGRPERAKAMPPFGRQATGWEIAYAALFFLSDESAYVTAQWLAVDSGVSGL